MEKFHEVVKNRHQYARAWKERTGGKILGYFCTYIPEEIVYAAGILPVRILGSHEPQDVTDPHIYPMFCPFCRDCLAQGILGRYDYLDGIAIGHSCMHIRQTFASWEMHVPVSYSYFIAMPAKTQSPSAKPFLRGEFAAFKTSLEEWTGKTVSEEDLDRGIDLLNTNRNRMRRIYESRKAEEPLISGADAMEMVLSSHFADKTEHNQWLSETLQELPKRDNRGDPGIRLMLIGSEDDDTEMIRLAEELGSTVVIDEHCTGSRYFWNEVVKGEDHLEAIAARYLDRPPCPQKDWPARLRIPHIMQLAQDYQVQGALVIQQKFCDPHEFDNPIIMRELKEKLGIPSLFLEFDITIPAGQFRTRIEAFLEMLQLEFI
jgi:benzoyl-CoA reductase subunit C